MKNKANRWLARQYASEQYAIYNTKKKDTTKHILISRENQPPKCTCGEQFQNKSEWIKHIA